MTRAWIALLVAGLAGCSEETPVTFSNIRVEEITHTSAVVRFDTNIATTCEVHYGLAEDAMDLRATDPDMDPNNPYDVVHEVPLAKLSPETMYFYQPWAVTPEGASYQGPVGSFSTIADTSDPNMLNVARLSEGTVVSEVSSNFGGGANDASWGANQAIDGDMGTEWATAGDGNGAFVTLDLGKARSLSRFGFRSRRMSDGTSIIKRVELVIDGATVLGPYDTPDPAQHYTFDFAAPVSATTVRVEAVDTTGGNTGAKEIELYETVQ